MSNITYELLKKSHISIIIEGIEKVCFKIPWTYEQFVDELENNRATYCVMFFEGILIGYAGFWSIYDEAHVTNIAIHPDFQSKGYGSKLLKYLISLALGKGLMKMTLEVREGNFKAIKLYEKFGFINVGIRKRYYADNNEDAIIMWNNHLCDYSEV